MYNIIAKRHNNRYRAGQSGSFRRALHYAATTAQGNRGTAYHIERGNQPVASYYFPARKQS